MFFVVYESLQIANRGDLWQNFKLFREDYDGLWSVLACWEISIQFSCHMSVREGPLL